MHIYVYGSLCRGEVAPGSDIDLLAVVDGPEPRFDPAVYSVYLYSQLRDLWAQGNPFAWHLSLEAKLVFAGDNSDLLRQLDRPEPYGNWRVDSRKFYGLFVEAADVLTDRRDSTVFELSTIFLAVRNFAICYSLHVGDLPVFSRRAFEKLGPDSLSLGSKPCEVLERSRILSTRGFGVPPSEADVAQVLPHLPDVERWMCALIRKG